MDFKSGDLVAFAGFNNKYTFGVFVSGDHKVSGSAASLILIDGQNYYCFNESIYRIDNLPIHLKHSSDGVIQND
jgi:hypothetical protein